MYGGFEMNAKDTMECLRIRDKALREQAKEIREYLKTYYFNGNQLKKFDKRFLKQ